MLRRLFKFSAVGVLNTVVDFSLLNLLSWLIGVYTGWGVAVLNSFSFLAAVTNSYFLNKFWTFRSQTLVSLREYGKFVSVILIGLIINSSIVFFLTAFIAPPFAWHPQIWLNVSKILALPLSTLWNFLFSQRLVFIGFPK